MTPANTSIDGLSHRFQLSLREGRPFDQGIKDGIKYASLASVAALITGIAFAVFGTGLSISGSLFGIVPLIISVPLVYFGFNIYQASQNARDVVNNPSRYRELWGFGANFDLQKIKDQINKGTVAFEWFTDMIFDQAVQ